jgi:hypothetical protein
VSEIRDSVKEFLAEPETERLMIEAVHAAKEPKECEPCTLRNLEINYPRLKEEIVYSRWLREEAIRFIRLGRADPIVLDCLNSKGKTFKLNLSAVQTNWIQFFFNITDDEIANYADPAK